MEDKLNEKNSKFVQENEWMVNIPQFKNLIELMNDLFRKKFHINVEN